MVSGLQVRQIWEGNGICSSHQLWLYWSVLKQIYYILKDNDIFGGNWVLGIGKVNYVQTSINGYLNRM